MRTYRTLRSALMDMPSCLTSGLCDDEVGIAAQAKRDAENPLAILRDLVKIEIDLIEEGEADYGPQQRRWIRNYHTRLCASV